MGKFKDIPTWVIVFAFIFIWPVGLALVILKYVGKENTTYEKVSANTMTIEQQTNDKLKKLKAKRKKYLTITIIQLVLAIVFFISLISSVVKEDDNISGGVFVNVIVFGILIPCAITFYKTDSLIKKIEAYQNLIIIRDIYDIKKLANYLNETESEVLNFIIFMIRENYLELKIENDKLIKPKEYIDPAQIFSIVCQSCGATNKYIKGKNNVCEYCGSILNIEKL